VALAILFLIFIAAIVVGLGGGVTLIGSVGWWDGPIASVLKFGFGIVLLLLGILGFVFLIGGVLVII
jgi:hypothetical protein